MNLYYLQEGDRVVIPDGSCYGVASGQLVCAKKNTKTKYGLSNRPPLERIAEALERIAALMPTKPKIVEDPYWGIENTTGVPWNNLHTTIDDSSAQRE